jgi:chromosome segregation ATPase
MGLFSNDTPAIDRLTATIEKQSEELANVKAELHDVRGQLSASREALKLTDDIVDLKKKVVDLEIQEAKLKETHEREKRDVEHMVGLEKKRQQFEINQAKRETTVSVREENLAADQARFTAQMEFHKEQIAGEITRFEKILAGLFDRLPTIEFGGDVADIRSRRAAGDD